MTDLIVANDWDAVRENFDPTMREKLTADGLATAWTSVVKEKGTFVSRGEPTQVRMDGDLVVFDTPMEFERGEMKSRVTLRATARSLASSSSFRALPSRPQPLEPGLRPPADAGGSGINPIPLNHGDDVALPMTSLRLSGSGPRGDLDAGRRSACHPGVRRPR